MMRALFTRPIDPRIDLSERAIAQWYVLTDEKTRRDAIMPHKPPMIYGAAPMWNKLPEAAKDAIKAKYIEVLTEGFRLQDEADSRTPAAEQAGEERTRIGNTPDDEEDEDEDEE